VNDLADRRSGIHGHGERLVIVRKKAASRKNPESRAGARYQLVAIDERALPLMRRA
jgi:hypothetical protein